MTLITINNSDGKTQQCKGHHCWGFRFNRSDEGVITCANCNTPYTLLDGEVEGVFPRPGMEYIDRYNALPRYSFLLNQSGGVVRTLMRSGNWIEVDDGLTLLSDAQDEIRELKERLKRLEPQLASPLNEFVSKQESLGTELSQALVDNLHTLYED